jgi:hypothetical protein
MIPGRGDAGLTALMPLAALSLPRTTEMTDVSMRRLSPPEGRR